MIEKIKLIFSSFNADKRLIILVVMGITGVLLLTLSEILPEKKAEESEDNNIKVNLTEEYEENLEKRLEELLSSISGAGKVNVMITLEGSDESVYATEQKQGEKSSEEKYVIVDNSKEETGLLLKVSEPAIRGVGIVCEGSDSAKVRQEIINTVSAVLNISSNRISIAKMKNNSGG